MATSNPRATEKHDLVKQRFSRNIKWQFVANGGQALLGGTYLIVLGRFLGPTEFGVFSAVSALALVIGAFLEMRLQEVVARDFCNIESDRTNNAVNPNLVIDLFLLEIFSKIIPSAGILIFSSPLARSINIPSESTELLVPAALGYLLSKSGNGVSSGLLRVLGRTDIIAGCVTLDWALRLTLTVAVALHPGLSVWAALWIALWASAVCNMVQIFLARREFEHRVAPIAWGKWKVRDAFTRLRNTQRLIGSNIGISASDLMAKDLDIAMISGVLSADKVGLYKMAKSFVQVIWRAIDPFYFAILPEVQKLWQEKQLDSLRQILCRASLNVFVLSTLLITICYASLVLFGQVMLGPAYAEVPELMLTMSIWVAICAPLIWGTPLAIAINRPELSVVGSLGGLAVGLTSFSLLTPKLGVTGAGLAWNSTLIVGVVLTTGLATWIAKLKHNEQSIRTSGS